MRLPARLLAAITLVTIAVIPATPASGSNTGERSSVLSFGGELCDVTRPMASADAPPYGVGPCPGVRPGAGLWSDAGGCSFNFYFKGYVRDEFGNLVEAGRFMGSAGHCAVDASEQEFVWPPGEGMEVREGTDTTRIGEYAYAINSDARDFSLIRLDPGVEANPQMCHFGGPTGMNVNANFTGNPGIVQHFGQGLVFGDTVSARSGVAHLTDPNWHLAATPILFGDSGSGIETEDGRALGVLVAISPIGMFITRLDKQIEPARIALGLESLELQTAPEL
jgi:hypothetical protein